MKKLVVKNEKRCNLVKFDELSCRVFKSLTQNSNFFILTRKKALKNFQKKFSLRNSKVAINFRCLSTFSRKRLNKQSFFSRHVFLKVARHGLLSGIRKAVW